MNKNIEISCPNCTGNEINVNEVDERSMYECQTCKHIWYSFRKTTNGPQVLMDEITDGVAEKGEFEIDGSVLINVLFRMDNNKNQSYANQLDEWADKNKLQYEFINSKKGNRVRFWR